MSVLTDSYRAAGYFTLALLLAVWGAQASTAQPNILVLMAEDLGPRVNAFGDRVAHTPNLDRLASEGVRYTRTFTTAGVCAPSRAAHILGMHQISTGTQHMRSSSAPSGGYTAVPPAGVKAYPELLREAGYYTFTDSKLDYQFSGIFEGSGPFTIWDDEGVSSWEGRAANQPFYGLLNFDITHESGVFTPLGNWPNSVTHFVMQVLRWYQHGDDPVVMTDPEAVMVPPYYPDTPTVRADIARHYDNTATMDRQVGLVLDALEAQGLEESTIVIWTTDHGDGLPRAKRELFDSGIHVPMIVRWPKAWRPVGLKPGDVQEQLVSLIDLAPAVLRLAGVARPGYLQGRDFSDSAAAPRDYVFAARDRIDEVEDRQRAIRSDRYKFIRSWYPQLAGGHPLEFRDNIDMVEEMARLYASGELDEAQQRWYQSPGEEQLFDLQRDPHELTNVVDDPAYLEVANELRQALRVRLAEIGDLSGQTEEEMVEGFWPEGEQPVTPAPEALQDGNTLVLRCVEEGASMAYRHGGGRWRLYTAPLSVDGLPALEARAVRYGWAESESTVWEPGQD